MCIYMFYAIVVERESVWRDFNDTVVEEVTSPRSYNSNLWDTVNNGDMVINENSSFRHTQHVQASGRYIYFVISRL